MIKTIKTFNSKPANTNEPANQVEEAEAILDCLRLLEAEACRLDLDASAHLIEVAAESLLDFPERTQFLDPIPAAK